MLHVSNVVFLYDSSRQVAPLLITITYECLHWYTCLLFLLFHLRKYEIQRVAKVGKIRTAKILVLTLSPVATIKDTFCNIIIILWHTVFGGNSLHVLRTCCGFLNSTYNLLTQVSTHSLTHPHTHTPIHSLTHSPTHTLTLPLTHSLNQSLTHTLPHTH